MEFEIADKQNILSKSIYDIQEESIITYGNNTDSDTSLCIENTYLTLDISSETGYVLGISGFLGELDNFPSIKVSEICSSKGILIYKKTQHLEKGIGYDVGYKGKIYFDKSKKVLVILMDKMSRQGAWFSVTTNICVLLDDEGKLCEIRIMI